MYLYQGRYGTQQLLNGFPQNLVERCGVDQGRTQSMLVWIHIRGWIQDFILLDAFYHILVTLWRNNTESLWKEIWSLHNRWDFVIMIWILWMKISIIRGLIFIQLLYDNKYSFNLYESMDILPVFDVNSFPKISVYRINMYIHVYAMWYIYVIIHPMHSLSVLLVYTVHPSVAKQEFLIKDNHQYILLLWLSQVVPSLWQRSCIRQESVALNVLLAAQHTLFLHSFPSSPVQSAELW